MTQYCSECGATLLKGATCQDIFDKFLILEFTDPGYGEVHMLTVACFMIQHGRYSEHALAWIGQKLRENLEENLSVEAVRRQARAETAQGKRSWKVMRQAGEPAQPKINWSMTIADIEAQYKDASSYCALVQEWAQHTLKEMRPLLD